MGGLYVCFFCKLDIHLLNVNLYYLYVEYISISDNFMTQQV